MKLTSKTDIDAPAEALFAAMTDLPWIERLAVRAGAEMVRADGGQGLTEGAAWNVRFRYRGRERLIESRVEAITPPRGLRLGGQSGGFGLLVEPVLIPLSRQTTRLALSVELHPRTFGARIMVQTLKIGKARLQMRLDQRLAAIARVLKDRADAR